MKKSHMVTLTLVVLSVLLLLTSYSRDWDRNINSDDIVPDPTSDAEPGAGRDIQTVSTPEETLVAGGFEVTVMEPVQWGTIRNSWSEYDGEQYFYLPVTIRNVSDMSQGFILDLDIIAPNGDPVDSIASEVDDDDITEVGALLPDSGTTSYLHVLYAGDGDYTIEFSNRAETVAVSFNVVK